MSVDSPFCKITYINVNSYLRETISNEHKQASSLLIDEYLKSKLGSGDMIEKYCQKAIFRLILKQYGVKQDTTKHRRDMGWL